jgi:hypothetical protein
MAGNGMAYDMEWSLEHFAIIPQISWKSPSIGKSATNSRISEREVSASEVLVTALQGSTKAPRAAAAAGFSSVLADRPRHDARGPRRQMLDSNNKVFLVKHSYVPAGICQAAGARSARLSSKRCGAN